MRTTTPQHSRRLRLAAATTVRTAVDACPALRRDHSSTGASAPRRWGVGAPARWRVGAPAPRRLPLPDPAAWWARRVGAPALGRWSAGAPAPRRPGAGTVWVLLPERWGRLGGGEIKSLHDKPNGCARAAMIGAITQKLRRNYADYAQITQKLRRLRRNYAYITQKLRMLRRNYAEITQKLRRNYAEITQKLRKKNYAKITRVCVICVISKITHTPFC